ncbi:hypothetical protein Hydth_1077 [Hydrogenobacter thermophilus TK-6]|uniref:Uncharacterized protein n=1 Tax=Hydrogenobacter thermophilus (strain DSM 6534 / IAM 12695 / TK-6) TaxID=608538 RepID=D3DI90_HYDTT|nr:hypothetical protein [Hydrogenobacter thermophilus]ADO45470.1 hypothetical protein Hydth_1077 [Hydrogenobacter thermophilus TK-6]BAI69542.1 hypothetical protein HTH_1084 [Hydrogenobacter thermophilus TK-6]
MVKYIIYMLVAFLIIDHVWTHYGPKIINAIASDLMGKETKVVEEDSERKSVLDNGIERLNHLKEKFIRR